MRFQITLNQNGRWSVIDTATRDIAFDDLHPLHDLSLGDALGAAEALELDDRASLIARALLSARR